MYISNYKIKIHKSLKKLGELVSLGILAPSGVSLFLLLSYLIFVSMNLIHLVFNRFEYTTWHFINGTYRLQWKIYCSFSI